jgi:hypothetical protein
MITLHQPPTSPPPSDVPSMRPSCAKLEAYLRMAKVASETKRGEPRSARRKEVGDLA